MENLENKKGTIQGMWVPGEVPANAKVLEGKRASAAGMHEVSQGGALPEEPGDGDPSSNLGEGQ